MAFLLPFVPAGVAVAGLGLAAVTAGVGVGQAVKASKQAKRERAGTNDIAALKVEADAAGKTVAQLKAEKEATYKAANPSVFHKLEGHLHLGGHHKAAAAAARYGATARDAENELDDEFSDRKMSPLEMAAFDLSDSSFDSLLGIPVYRDQDGRFFAAYADDVQGSNIVYLKQVPLEQFARSKLLFQRLVAYIDETSTRLSVRTNTAATKLAPKLHTKHPSAKSSTPTAAAAVPKGAPPAHKKRSRAGVDLISWDLPEPCLNLHRIDSRLIIHAESGALYYSVIHTTVERPKSDSADGGLEIRETTRTSISEPKLIPIETDAHQVVQFKKFVLVLDSQGSVRPLKYDDATDEWEDFDNLMPKGKTAALLSSPAASFLRPSHVIAVTPQGEAYSIGANHKGQLGLGHTDGRGSFEKIPGLAAPIVQAFTFENGSLLLDNEGTVYGFGEAAARMLSPATLAGANLKSPVVIKKLGAVSTISLVGDLFIVDPVDKHQRDFGWLANVARGDVNLDPSTLAVAVFDVLGDPLSTVPQFDRALQIAPRNRASGNRPQGSSSPSNSHGLLVAAARNAQAAVESRNTDPAYVPLSQLRRVDNIHMPIYSDGAPVAR